MAVTATSIIQEVNRYRTMRLELARKVITPRSVVGGGYINGRQVAKSWILNQLRSNLEKLAQVDPNAGIAWEVGECPSNAEFIRAAKVTYGADSDQTKAIIALYSK
jgi:hypothetical protein